MLSFTRTQEEILKKLLGVPCGNNLIDDFILTKLFCHLKGPVKMFKGTDTEFEKFILGSNVYAAIISNETKELSTLIAKDFLSKLEKVCDKFSFFFQSQAFEHALRAQTSLTCAYIVMKYHDINF